MATVDWLSNLSNQTILNPRSHLVEAHEYIGEHGERKVAVDCACGNGRDTSLSAGARLPCLCL